MIYTDIYTGRISTILKPFKIALHSLIWTSEFPPVASFFKFLFGVDTKRPITKLPMLQNAKTKTPNYKTPNATKVPITKRLMLQNANVTKRPMLHNVQNRVRDSIFFNISEAAALGPLAIFYCFSVFGRFFHFGFLLHWAFCKCAFCCIRRLVALGVFLHWAFCFQAFCYWAFCFWAFCIHSFCFLSTCLQNKTNGKSF